MTKARTRNAKLKAKRGPKAREGMIRTPSGQISRSAESRANIEAAEANLAVEAATWRRRQQDPSLTPEEARKQEHGSVIHRWHQEWLETRRRSPDKAHPNEFTRTHLEAAERFHQLVEAWGIVTTARRQRSSSDFSGSGGYDGRDPFDGDLAEKHRAIEEDYKAARKAILDSGPLGMMAVESVVLENRDIPSMRPDLRLALNRLAIIFKWQDQAA